jgi:hypothetical protein
VIWILVILIALLAALTIIVSVAVNCEAVVSIKKLRSEVERLREKAGEKT